MLEKESKNQGITLVALIITIIILIILAAVTINLLMNTKFIDTAIGGTQNYQEAQYKEAEDIDKLNGKLEKAIKDIEDAGNGEQSEEGVPDGYIKPRGTITITENGNYDIAKYEQAEVNVPIPEGYVEPKGTQKITTKSDKIDVKNYEYADTTSLYTADESQFGEGVCWKKDTLTFPTNTTSMEYNCGFKPRVMLLQASILRGESWNFFSYDYCNTVGGIVYIGSDLKNYTSSGDYSQYFSVTDQGVKFLNWADHAKGCTINIYVMK